MDIEQLLDFLKDIILRCILLQISQNRNIHEIVQLEILDELDS